LYFHVNRLLLQDPKGVLCKGSRAYRAVFASLRVLSVITGMHPHVKLQNIAYNEPRKFVEARLELSFGAALMGEPYKLSALSQYKLNDEGLVYEHDFDNILKRDLWDFSENWKAAGSVAGSSNSGFPGMQQRAGQAALARIQQQQLE
jgi:hypothetical protein